MRRITKQTIPSIFRGDNMNEKSLIFILSTNRGECFQFLQDISYYTYEKAISSLSKFIFEKFQLKHHWEKEYILDLLYNKLEVSHDCYVSDSNFSCIFGEFLTCDNATDVYCSECDILKSRAVIYNQRHDGSLKIVAYYKNKLLCELNAHPKNNAYDYTFEKTERFKNYFDINEDRLNDIRYKKDCSEVAELLSKVFSLPFAEKPFTDFVDSAKKHVSFGVGGKYDSPDTDDEPDFIDSSINVSPETIEHILIENFRNGADINYASIHVLTDDVSEIKSRVIDISSHPILPDAEKLSYYEKRMLNKAFGVLGYDFCDTLVKGTPLSKSLKERNIYCMKNSHGYSLFSDSFLVDTAESEVETYFSCGYMPYVIVFEIDEGEMLCLKLYKNDALSGEITVFSKSLSQRNIWSNAELICSLLGCDIRMLKKSVDKNDLSGTAYRWADITGLPLNVSYEKVSHDPELHSAQKWQ